VDPKIFAFFKEPKGWTKAKPALKEGSGFHKDVVMHKEFRAPFQGLSKKFFGSLVVGIGGISQGIDGGGIKKDQLLPGPHHGVRKRVGDPPGLRNLSR